MDPKRHQEIDSFVDATSGDLWRCLKCNLVHQYFRSQPGCPRCKRREADE